jgi:L-methionine (R)-S-oxide reductase
MTPSSQQQLCQQWLDAFVQRHGATSGTVHLRALDSDLRLVASCNIPPPVLTVIEVIPKGKGMAGLAWERNQPVSTCNLKTDSTGDVRPLAQAVHAQAAVALPVHSTGPAQQAGQVAGVVGIAFREERELSEQELYDLNLEAQSVPRILDGFPGSSQV